MSIDQDKQNKRVSLAFNLAKAGANYQGTPLGDEISKVLNTYTELSVKKILTDEEEGLMYQTAIKIVDFQNRGIIPKEEETRINNN